MEFDHTIVSLAFVRDDDVTYRITTGDTVPNLSPSIEKVGLINPPILSPRGEQFTIISGFGRIAACRSLHWETIPARCLRHPFTSLDCALLAVADNAAQRRLNMVEMARAWGLLVHAAGEKGPTPLQWLHTLGVPVNAQLGKMLDTVNQMNPHLQQGLIEDTIALPTALRLQALTETETVDIFCRMFRELQLSLNRQREILDWTQAIAVREATSMSAVLSGDPIVTWLDDSRMDRGRKTQLIREHLKRRRYPEMVRFEQNYQSGLKAVNFPKEVRFEPPAHFEGRTFGLHFSFKDQKELMTLFEQVEEKLHSAEFLNLLSPAV